MKLYLDCYPCILNQTLSAMRGLGLAEEPQKEIFKSALQILANTDPERAPVETVADVHAVIKERTGIEDLYVRQKQESTRAALSLYPRAKAIVERSHEALDAAVRLSIAGNVIDFGVNNPYDLESEMERVLAQPYAVNHLAELRNALGQANSILFLGDNAGETVFDRLLIETIKKPVIYAVRGKPTLNDAIESDALEAGIDSVASIISSGVDTPGTVLSRASQDFLDIYFNADVIISKGQGNYESLSGQPENIFFLLQTKCMTLSRSVGSSVGGMVVRSAQAAL